MYLMSTGCWRHYLPDFQCDRFHKQDQLTWSDVNVVSSIASTRVTIEELLAAGMLFSGKRRRFWGGLSPKITIILWHVFMRCLIQELTARARRFFAACRRCALTWRCTRRCRRCRRRRRRRRCRRRRGRCRHCLHSSARAEPHSSFLEFFDGKSAKKKVSVKKT